jgi:hypothetical protein
MRKLIDYRIAGLVLAVAGAFSTQACDKANDALGGNELLKQCGLVCPEKGIIDGNASISGIQGIDAFFGSVVNFNAKANLVSENILGEIAKINLSLGLAADAPAADIKAAMIAKFHLDAKAGIKIAYTPAKCAVSAKATIEATAKCDATVDPGKAEVTCSGSCEADASVKAECDASATVKCTGTAPMFDCSGECKGSCELDAAASCSGTCKGTCDGNCSAKDAMGQCTGSCDGMCTGTCEMAASASCSGKCKGECTYTPPKGAMCEAGATVKCEAAAKGSVKCEGKCDGTVEPPMASAECQASAKADASVNVECTPPSLDLAYQFDAKLSASAQADAQANFEAFLVGFKGSFSAIVADLAQAKVVGQAGIDIGASAEGAVTDAVKAIDITASLKVSVGVGCAITELGNVAGALKDSGDKLKASGTAAASLTAAFGG